jgi:hypothetical protein
MERGAEGVRGQGVPAGQPLPEPPSNTGVWAWITRIFSSCFKRAEQPPGAAMDRRQIERVEERSVRATISRLFRKLFGGPERVQAAPQQVALVTLKSEVLTTIQQQITSNRGIGAAEILKALIPPKTREECGQALLYIFANESDLNTIETNHTSDLLRMRNLVEELLKADANAMLGQDDEKQQVIQRQAILWIPLVVQTIVNEIQRNPSENRSDQLERLLIDKFNLLIDPLFKMRQVPPNESYEEGQNVMKALRGQIQQLVKNKIRS